MSISSLTLSSFSRSTIQRVQTQLVDAQKEFNTGRHADVGRTLGRVTGNAINYRAQEDTFNSMLTSNNLISSRFNLMDNALSSIRTSGDDFSKALINGTATGTGTAALVQSAQQGLQQVLGAVNVSSGGDYLFAGTHTNTQPVKSDSTALTTLNATMQTNFLNALGISDVSAAKADDVKAYFSDAGLPRGGTTYRFSTDFDAQWATFADAGGQVSTAQISKSETIQTSVSASSDAFKNTVAAYTMIGALGVDQMGDGARQALTTAAQTRLKMGQDGIVKVQADLGVRQTRVAAANALLTKQKDIVADAYGRLENVDQTEAGLMINQLKTQLDATFAVTGKLQGLSILNYL
ncbi:flagellar hook-associated family protein [Aureimonas ureilytica]|uniref:flagellar hook-associated family protein n=1 Tax=Aureimonas ureilytica TaxID=401562 RepID=UPI003CEAC49F